MALSHFQPDSDWFFTAQGSVFSRKRTSLFEFINLDSVPELKYISDLPSSGDTAYEGVIVEDGRLYITYYTSDPTKDPAWILGMLTPSDIYLTNMSVASLFSAATNPLTPPTSLPWDNYIIFFANIGFSIGIVTLLVRRNSRKKESHNDSVQSSKAEKANLKKD